MKVAMMFYQTPASFDARGTEQGQEISRAWDAYIGDMIQNDKLAGGEALLPPATARTVQLKAGAHHVQDGPYADTKEQLGGFVILNVADMDEAQEWAAKCPEGVVEIRPVLDRTA
jgi:hypothetical protein